ncbi:hypothetical protein Hanom_Chr00s000001g01596821 [Helianthus anomalus]
MDSCLTYHEFYQGERELTVNRRTFLPLKRFFICQEDTEEEIDTETIPTMEVHHLHYLQTHRFR